MKRKLMVLAPLLALLANGCGSPQKLSVTDAVVKLSPVDQNPSALYFTINGGPGEVELLRVTSPSVIRTEMHDSISDPKTGMLSMKPLERVKVPANSKIEFKRGSKHVMLFGVNLVARRLQKLDAEFVFSNGDRIAVTAPIEKISAGKDEHAGH
jgi:periplasmic copper chaperone A